MKIKCLAPSTIEELIQSKMQGISKSKLKQWIKFQKIILNNAPVKRLDQEVTPQDELILELEKDSSSQKTKAPFPILYEDPYLIAAHKPAGLLTVGEGEDRYSSFFKIVQSYVRSESNGKKHLYVIHRLDREVEGIVLFAKEERILQEIKNAWKNNTKRYYALVEGSLLQKEGTIQTYLLDDHRTFKVRSVQNSNHPDAKLAITHYKVVEELKTNTLLEITLETGRKNQIRAHLSEMGHPIVGDRRYGADARFERQIRLFSFYLKFHHPIKNEWIEVTLPLPKNFLHITNKDEKYK